MHKGVFLQKSLGKSPKVSARQFSSGGIQLFMGILHTGTLRPGKPLSCSLCQRKRREGRSKRLFVFSDILFILSAVLNAL